MRLKPEKIEHLATIIFEALTANKEITLGEGRDMIVGTIRRIITEDLTAEDQIEEEARRRLEEFKDQISRQGASYDKLFLKAKQTIAKERKMVL